MPACAVLFWISYICVTLVALSKAFCASSCSHFTMSRLLASVAITCEARAPFSPISLNTGANASMLPISLKRSMIIRKPAFASSAITFLNCSAFRFSALANLSLSLYASIISFDTAVADISAACPFASRTAPMAISCGSVMPAALPTPPIRLAKFARYAELAVQFWDSSVIVEPIDSSACSVPSSLLMPKMSDSFDSTSVAPSPMSDSATLIWSAPRT